MAHAEFQDIAVGSGIPVNLITAVYCTVYTFFTCGPYLQCSTIQHQIESSHRAQACSTIRENAVYANEVGRVPNFCKNKWCHLWTVPVQPKFRCHPKLRQIVCISWLLGSIVRISQSFPTTFSLLSQLPWKWPSKNMIWKIHEPK